MAACLNGKYRRIIADYGELTGESFCECTRCDKKVLVGAFSEWQMEAFLEAVRMIPEHDEKLAVCGRFWQRRDQKRMGKTASDILYSHSGFSRCLCSDSFRYEVF